ncbi:MAG: alpha/beta fold hydrolase [Anaerolineales bacterium]|nr:alpha/beta fold hydrolase [Anaerolineales bacterium]
MKKTFSILILFSLLLTVSRAPRVIPPTATPPPPAEQPTSQPTNTAAILKDLGGYPCPESDFTCIDLTVPLDHFDAASTETIKVVFAVLPASGERKGMFVTVTGGPGTAGISLADNYAAAMDASILEHFDIVFFDQRGAGLSSGMQCPNAAATYYLSDADAATPQGEADLVNAARVFAQDCVREMGDVSHLLPYMGTDQAVADLEAFRQAMGDEKFWLDGESYGTQYVQTYAATHSDHLAGLILESTVDLTLSGENFLIGQARAFNNTLKMTLEACNQNEACAADFGGDALAAYDTLSAELAAAAQPFTFPLPSGGTQARLFTLSNLESAAVGFLYSEGACQVLLRALAYAARDGDLVQLARVLYNALYLDPETLAPVVDPSWSDAVYYAVECNDYNYFSGTPDERAQAYLRYGDTLDASLPNFSGIFYGDLPCVFWPHGKTPDVRPAPLAAAGIPTLVLGATADPATPVDNGRHVFANLTEGYLVTTQGGAHVIYGRGDACPDDLVTDFLVSEALPDRETACEGVVADAYVPIAPRSAADFADPLAALASADDEISYLPEYFYWDGETPTAIGCPFGGRLSFEAIDAGEAFTLDQCAFSQGFTMTGAGSYNYDEERFTLDVIVSGLAGGTLSYTRESDGALHVTGTYNGQTIDLSR